MSAEFPSSSRSQKDDHRSDDDSDEEIEWEEWKPNEISFYHHMVAGSIAGLAEHVTLFPVDTIKTNIQCQKCGSTSPFKCATRMIQNEGLFRLWRGVTATFAGCIPAHAAYFSVYESMKIVVKADHQDKHQPFRAGLCGAMAAISHDLFMTPFDVIKQRMQLGYYRNTLHTMKMIIKTEGLSPLFVSLPTTLLTNIPHGCLVVAANESAKKVLNPSGKYNIPASLLSGCIAGGIAAALTTPLDVIKTRLQTQDLVPCLELVNNGGAAGGGSHNNNSNPTCAMEKKYPHPTTNGHTGNMNNLSPAFTASGNSMRHLYTKSDIPTFQPHSNGSSRNIFQLARENYQMISNIVRRIVSEEGYRGFWRGTSPRIIAQAPAVALSWTVYEGAKTALGWKPPSSSIAY